MHFVETGTIKSEISIDYGMLEISYLSHFFILVKTFIVFSNPRATPYGIILRYKQKCYPEKIHKKIKTIIKYKLIFRYREKCEKHELR